MSGRVGGSAGMCAVATYAVDLLALWFNNLMFGRVERVYSGVHIAWRSRAHVHIHLSVHMPDF